MAKCDFHIVCCDPDNDIFYRTIATLAILDARIKEIGLFTMTDETIRKCVVVLFLLINKLRDNLNMSKSRMIEYILWRGGMLDNDQLIWDCIETYKNANTMV